MPFGLASVLEFGEFAAAEDGRTPLNIRGLVSALFGRLVAVALTSAPQGKPIKSSEIARKPSTKIIQGDWHWHGNRNINDPHSVWHNYRGQPIFEMLFADGHVENYLFPKEYKNWDYAPAPNPEFLWW